MGLKYALPFILSSMIFWSHPLRFYQCPCTECFWLLFGYSPNARCSDHSNTTVLPPKIHFNTSSTPAFFSSSIRTNLSHCTKRWSWPTCAFSPPLWPLPLLHQCRLASRRALITNYCTKRKIQLKRATPLTHPSPCLASSYLSLYLLAQSKIQYTCVQHLLKNGAWTLNCIILRINTCGPRDTNTLSHSMFVLIFQFFHLL